MKLETAKALGLFQEKHDRLSRSNFGKMVIEGGEATEDEIDAYILTLRFFIQDREPCSIRNISKIYEQECQDPNLHRDFSDLRDHLRAELDQESPYTFHSGRLHSEGESKRPSYRYIFFGLLYAEYAHSNWEHYDLVPEMLGSSFGRFINRNIFVNVLHLYHLTIVEMNAINRQAFPTYF